MNILNFLKYNKDAELTGGDYWKFLEATSETLVRDEIILGKIGEIIGEITNPDLKSKMKDKLFSLLIENGIYFNVADSSLDIFNVDELKLLLKNEYLSNIVKYLLDSEKLQHYSGDIINFINLLKKVDNDEWVYFIIVDILDKIKDYQNKTLFINIIESIKDRKGIFNRIIADYYNYLPMSYQNFLKMQKDPNYIYNKYLKFMDENIDIGIDPRIKIATEIEANSDFNFQLDLGNQSGYSNYRVSFDATVYNGSEVTPRQPFHNVREDVAKFCGLCETMEDIGYYYSEASQNAAGQINLGLDYLDTKEAILIFYEIYCNCEELLYYICNGNGQLFRQDVYCNSRIKAISEIIGVRILDEDLSREDVIALFNNRLVDNEYTIRGLEYKKNSVCLRGTSEDDYRLEFRIPNGGCNYRIWIDNIRLFGKMMEMAKRLAAMMKKDDLSPDDEYLLKLKIDLQDSKLSMEEKLILLMDLLFSDDSIKQIYYDRYYATIKKIAETGSTKYIQSTGAFDPSFDEVEFMEQYHTMLNPNSTGNGLIVTYDPESDVITSNKKI